VKKQNKLTLRADTVRVLTSLHSVRGGEIFITAGTECGQTDNCTGLTWTGCASVARNCQV
jgi:hypothetical protein